MIQIPTLLLTVTALISVKVGLTIGKCRFPDYLVKREPWAGDYKGGQLIAYIHPTYIKVSESFDGGHGEPFQKECVKRGPDGKFMVKLRKRRHPIEYQCLQFLKRSENIVQLKTSKRYDRHNMEICHEKNMKLDPFPWVQLTQGRDVTECPFVGGYNFYAFYHYPNNSLVCNNNRLLMRIESECDKGAGIEFNFRQVSCLPERLPRKPVQKLRCVAHWTQKNHTFIILRHAEDPQQWLCMRTSNPLSNIEEAYLWMQVVCDDSEIPNPEVSINYLKLQLNRIVYSSTCADEIEVCEGEQEFCDTDYAQHCALTCQQCRSEDEIGLCTFDEQFRGQWMDSGQNGDFLMDIETYTIRGQGIYNCLNLDADVFPEKRVLLETYENGCLPRYACTEISKVNSSVMMFRLGTRHVWPLRNVKSKKEYICNADNFKRLTESRYPMERPPRLLTNTRDNKELPCGLPEHLQNGISFEEDGRKCHGCLYYNPSKNLTQFVVRPVNCTNDNSSFKSLPISYSCIASFNFHPGTHSVVTKTSSLHIGMGQFLLWTFTKNNQIKVMKASEAFVYEHKQHPGSEYILAQFSIRPDDTYKCAMNTYIPTQQSTTTTPQGNEHWIDHRPRTTPEPNRGDNQKGGKYTYYPEKTHSPDGKSPGQSNVTPYPSQSGNLRGGNGRSPSSVYHCNVSLILLITLLAMCRVTFFTGHALTIT